MDKQTIFKKEFRKFLILLGIGFGLAIYIVLSAANMFGFFHLGTSDILILAVVILYPLGLVYGWRQMFGIYNGARSGDRRYVAHSRNIGNNTVAISLFNIAFSLMLTFTVGWIVGVVRAIKILVDAKNQADYHVNSKAR